MSDTKDCSHHSKDIAGITDMTLLAEMICDLNYESFHELTQAMVIKLRKDSDADFARERKVLGMVLKNASESMKGVRNSIRKAAEISKPYL